MEATQEELMSDLVELCRDRCRAVRWWDRLNQPQKNQLLRLRKQFRAGKMPGCSLSSMHQVLKDQGFDVGRTSFKEWMQSGE